MTPYYRRGPHCIAKRDRAAFLLGLDIVPCKSSLDEEIYRQLVREQQEGGVLSRRRPAPAFFVNGQACDVSNGIRELVDSVAVLARCARGAHGMH